MNKLQDFLTYQKDINGKRRLRFYVQAALFIIMALIIVMAVILYQRVQIHSVMAATRPVVVEPTSTPTATATQPSTLTPVVNACPTDPSKWNLVDPAPGNQYDRIDPPCVYDGLGRTIAWSLAIKMGYSRGEANDLLGFSFDASKNNPAMVSLQSVTILTDTSWIVAPVGLNFTPTDPEFTEWSITPDGEPAITFSILGCFRTMSVVGNETKDWGDGYPVMCVIAEDTQTGYHVSSLGGHLYTGGIVKANRVPSLFGYASEGRWIWLGNEAGINVDQSHLTQAQLQNGYKIISMAYQAPTWNSQWLKDTFGIQLKPLPNGWLTANNASDQKAILDLLNGH